MVRLCRWVHTTNTYVCVIERGVTQSCKSSCSDQSSHPNVVESAFFLGSLAVFLRYLFPRCDLICSDKSFVAKEHCRIFRVVMMECVEIDYQRGAYVCNLFFGPATECIRSGAPIGTASSCMMQQTYHVPIYGKCTTIQEYSLR